MDEVEDIWEQFIDDFHNGRLSHNQIFIVESDGVELMIRSPNPDLVHLLGSDEVFSH